MSHHKRQKSNKKRGSNHRSKSKHNESSKVMDDVMAQRQRQREKQKSDVQMSSSTADDQMMSEAARNEQPKSMGGFIYDPVLKRYLPKSAYKSNGNNDVCIQRIQNEAGKQKNMMDAHESKWCQDDKSATSLGAVIDRDVRRIVFRASSLRFSSSLQNKSASMESRASSTPPEKKSKKRKKPRNCNKLIVSEHANSNDTMGQSYNMHSCSPMSIIVLATSLSYCSSTRRKDAASILGSLCTVDGLQVIPALVNREMFAAKNEIGCIIPCKEKDREMGVSTSSEQDSKCMEQKKPMACFGSHLKKTASLSPVWYSMLTPICFDLNRAR